MSTAPAAPPTKPAAAPARDWPAAVALAAVAVAFALTRSLTREQVYFLGLDEPVYLGLAAHLPAYTLYGGVGFVNHPPLYPVLIRLASALMSAPCAGLAVSTGAQIVAGIFVWRIARRMGYGALACATVLALLVLNNQWHVLAGWAYKETTYVACVFGLLAAWLALVDAAPRALVSVVAWAVALVAASDYSVFAIAGMQFGIAVFAFTARRWHVRLLVPSVVGAGAYVLWLGWRLSVYRSAPEVAVGIGGMLEPTDGIGLRQLLTPQALPFTSELTAVRTGWPSAATLQNLVNTLYAFGPVDWAWRRGWPTPGWPIQPGALCAGVGFLWLMYTAVRDRDARRRGFARLLLILALVLCLPASQEIVQHRVRMFLVLPAIAALGLADAFAVRARGAKLPRRQCAAGVVIVLAAAAAVAVATLPYVVWFRPVQVEAQAAIDWLNARPPERVMTQIGYGQEIAWRTPHVVYGMPTDAAALERQIAEHTVRYLVYGTHYWQSPDSDGRRPVWNAAIIAAIRADPDRYPLVATLTETYLPPFRGLTGDTLWIHKVDTAEELSSADFTD